MVSVCAPICWLSAVLLQLLPLVATEALEQCPRLLVFNKAQDYSSNGSNQSSTTETLDLEGFRLFINLNDEELRSAVPSLLFEYTVNRSGILNIIENGIISSELFSNRQLVEQFVPAVSSLLAPLIPFHISSPSKVYYSMSIISPDESILGPINDVSPNAVEVYPGIVRDLNASFCCRDIGTVLLEGCLTITKEPFNAVTGPHQTIGPFYAKYECKVASPICPSSFQVDAVKVQLCFTVEQARILADLPGWEILVIGGGVDGLCALEESVPFKVRISLRNRDAAEQLPLPPSISSMQIYLDRAVLSGNNRWTTPTYYSIEFYPDNDTIMGEITSVSTPLHGTFDTDTLEFTINLTCLTNGETFFVGSVNTSGLVDNYVVNNSFTIYFYKICMFNETTTQTDSFPLLVAVFPSSIFGFLLITIAVTVTVICLVWYSWRKKMQLAKLEELAISINKSYNAYTVASGFSPFDFLEDVEDLVEYNFAALEIEQKLGEGFFGNVYKARAPGLSRGDYVPPGQYVAVKTLTGDSEREILNEFAKELKICLKFDHPNVIRLVGVCTESLEKCMIFEYMDLGSLVHCLRSSNPSDQLYNPANFTLSKKQFLPIVLQLAKGIQYLAGLSITHRDIAARNCLLNSQLVAKIADFGLSRNLDAQNYYKVGGAAGSLPIRWMPPEAILYRKFTAKSDVWSFGVLMWEVYTFGQIPYTGLSNHEVIDSIREHKILYQPGGCPGPVYNVMNNCWTKIPAQRPGITEIIRQIELHMGTTP